MDHVTANFFTIPIGIGSCLLFIASRFDKEEISFLTDNGTHYNEISLLLLFSFLYFAIDLVLMIKYYKPKYLIYFVHHLVAMRSIIIVYFQNYILIKFLLGYLTFELTSPILRICVSYQRRGINNYISKILNVCALFLFIIIRIIFGTYLFIVFAQFIYPMSEIYWYIILPFILQSMNFYWLYRIIYFFFGKEM